MGLKNTELLLLLFTFLFGLNSSAQTAIVPHGHSHNDYTRKRPLYDALANGFQSIEVDVFYYKKELVVSHVHAFLFWKKTLEELYIVPLDSIYRKQGKFFAEDSAQLILYIDTKNKNDSICAGLLSFTEKYPALFSRWENGKEIWGPVKLLSSCYHLETDEMRYIQKNGGLSEIDLAIDEALFPRVNSAYAWNFKWRGKGEMPEKEVAVLRKWVEKAHAQNRKIRFWGAGNKTAIWQKLLDENVDWINVDKLEKYREYYFNNRK